MVITISGEDRLAQEWLREVARQPVWTIETNQETQGTRTIRITGPINVPFREIGGLIFTAQRHQQALSLSTIPLICGGVGGAMKPHLSAFELAEPQVLPKALFGVGALAAELSGDGSRALFRHAPSPLTQPSPHRGEGLQV